MKPRVLIVVLLLLVLPTALLTLVAGQSLRDRELFLDARIQASARNAVRAVAQNVSTHLEEDLVDLKTAVADALQRGGNEAELQQTLRPLIESHPLIREVYVFMNPGGFVFAPAKESEAETVVRSELTEVLRRAIASGDAQQAPIPVSLEDRAWQFSRIDARRALYIGMEVSRSGCVELLRESIMTFSGGGITLCAVGPGLGRPVACDSDQGSIVVTDSFSRNATGSEESTATGNGSGSLTPPARDVLVEVRLSPPLDPIRVTAWATDPEGLRRGQRRGLQVQAWGLGLLVLCMGLGIALVLRLTSAEVHAARARSEFVMGVSHDLRTPIASMKMLAESLVAGRVADPDKRQHFLRVMLRECERLNQLVERVLFFVRFGQGDIAYQRQVMDPGALVQGAVQAFRARHSMMNAHRSSADAQTLDHRPWTMDRDGEEGDNDSRLIDNSLNMVAVMLSDGLPAVKVDGTAMTQVLLNLLDNAWKYSQEKTTGEKTTDDGLPTTDGGEGAERTADHGLRTTEDRGGGTDNDSRLTNNSPITVSVRAVVEKWKAWEPEREWVAVSVEDRGMGIDPESQKQIFQKFYRGPGARHSNVSGVGVGLALCRHVVRGHGGRIDIESTPGKGSTFTIYLPVAERES